MKKIFNLLLCLMLILSNSIICLAGDGDYTDIKQWKYNSHTYGFTTEDDDCRYNNGTQVKENDVTSSINIYNLGDYSFYPYIRMRYKDATTGDSYKEAYITSNHLSTVKGSLVVQCALENPGGYTIGVDTQWDGWTKTMEGIRDTKILSNNNDDRNVVANGGSTMFLYTANTPGANKPAPKPVESHLGIIGYMTAVPDEITSHFTTYNMTQSDAENAFIMFAEDVANNTAHFRLEKIMAEGVYRQGEESEFENNAVLVDGIGLSGGYHPVASTFGSFNGTAGNGQGNKLDRVHKKYYLENKYELKEKTNVIDSQLTYDIDTFKISSDIKTKDLTSILHFTASGDSVGSSSNFDIEIATKKLKPTVSSGGTMQDAVYDLIAKELKSHSEWDELNRVTGFVDNYINALDFNMGNNKKTRNADTSFGDYSRHNLSSGGNSNSNGRENWYNEGQDGLCCVRLKANIELKLNNQKWEVLDPALCGQSISKYDLRNWTDNDNDGKKDSDLTSTGCLKDKVRTFRYQLSKGYSYYDSVNADVFSHKKPKTTTSEEEEEEEEEEDNTPPDTFGEDGLLGFITDANDNEFNIYCDNMHYALKSKLLYQDNTTVEGSSQ